MILQVLVRHVQELILPCVILQLVIILFMENIKITQPFVAHIMEQLFQVRIINTDLTCNLQVPRLVAAIEVL